MRRVVPVALGLVAAVLGVVWTLQGLGYLKHSAMTGVSYWAVVGPILAGFGVALAIVGIRRHKS